MNLQQSDDNTSDVTRQVSMLLSSGKCQQKLARFILTTVTRIRIAPTLPGNS